MENFIFLCIYSFCKTLHLKFIVNLCYVIHQNTFRTLAYLELCLFRYTEAFSIIFSTIKACSVLIRYIQNPVKVSYSQPCLMPSPARCKIGGILKPYETSPRHIQNSTIARIVLGIAQPYSGILRTLSNPCIYTSLACWQFWNIQNSSIITSRRIVRILIYLYLSKPLLM